MKKPLLSHTIILFFLVSLSPSPPPLVAALISTSTTISISNNGVSTTVCGILAGNTTQRIQCFRAGQTFFISPNVSFESISGGPGLLCGLRSGGFSLLCWDTNHFHPKRIYYSADHPLTDLTVGGTSQVCAIHVGSGAASCWKRFPAPQEEADITAFDSITSGGGFSCGITKKEKKIVCWGNQIGAQIQKEFSNYTMVNFVAGKSHACGLMEDGSLICKGNNADGQLDVPSHSNFEFANLALGTNHTCAIRRINGLVLCWGRGFNFNGFEYYNNPIKTLSFESITAGWGITCGITTKNLTVVCWGPGWSAGLLSLPLLTVIPGPCKESSCSICGIFPNSANLCAGSTSICKSCDIELPIPAFLPPPLPPGSSPQPLYPHRGAKERLLLAFGIVGSIGLVAGICSIGYLLWRLGVCRILQDRTIDGENSVKCGGGSLKLNRQRSGTSSQHADKAEEFSLVELSAATGNFAEENKIGGGSFGTVYRGKLFDGREVAIKRGDMNPERMKLQEKETAFGSELASLSRLNHKHLVGLIGYCQEKDKEERLLVYEYMRNGSLHDHLHNNKNKNNMLSCWKMRIKIALDAARGIEYLHNYAVPPVIHRDIKSSNILLDSDWTAKVSDFGLSLMGPKSDQEAVMSTKAVGTVGYIDPEYYVLNILTVKSDIYSLGVVLLELLTGKRAVFKDGPGLGPIGVVDYARKRIMNGELLAVLDRRVEPMERSEAEEEAVEVLAYMAVRSVSLEGRERPNIGEIVANLERAFALCEQGTTSSFLP
ncbi:putative serine/threonine-protein kinase-like protein CCR3 [Impatiens glandulifera]|uniref:putative serine/threonine-protein kinase-like protein CCR3 n=1 Tax=Impatiens glandulifera TaxID=253017 RepID=UPI001FB1A18D|nr:putative serine/threonine-protein kinase-like protein CCR3 [Impatiens glandulifera]